MKIINRYIYKEFFPPFLSGTLFFTILFLLQHLKKLSEMMFEKNIPVSIVLELLIYTIPFTAAITIPMGTLFGALFSLGRLSQDSEMLIMRSSGISLFKILKPIFIIGVSITLFLFYFMNYIMTEANLRYKSIYINILYSNPGVVMTPKFFTSFSDGNQKITAYKIDESGELHYVYLYDMDTERNVIKMIFARKGRWINNKFNTYQLSLNLYDGEIIQFNREERTVLDKVIFKKITFNVLNDIQSIGIASQGLREMNFLEIHNLIKTQIDNNQKPHPYMYIEYHRKFSIPIACLAFIVISIPLSVSFGYRSKGTGLGISLIVVFIYYFLMTTMEGLGKKDIINPSLAMHLPNIIFGTVAFILLLLRIRK